MFNVAGRLYITSRIAWILAHGRIPDGLLVCHHCDNPTCVRPDHLFLGTARDNARDMSAKNRAPKGTNTKLTADDVLAIRAEYKRGMGGKLGRKYGVTYQTIHEIVRGISWKHLPESTEAPGVALARGA